ncbi:arsenate reductase ArsC [Jiella pelagia]|uniref:Arsenate reductase ArsC n=1 Tax=Jiella pelagia TaxID=2986949 RepID=A0ABY7C4W4_9HYPH|nr:arsenate reductase ArsC [Jiella pelagia]WAP69880.1 arsenate reductase ArsC [Jiella pelagia]
MTDEIYNVLFLCTGNSARSIIAESIMNRGFSNRFRAFSAGSQPRGEIHPLTLDLLRRLNFPVDGLRSKPWEEFAEGRDGAPELHFVFTVCDDAAGEACPVWPGQPMSAHWGVPDPARAEGSPAMRALSFAETFRQLNNRISIFASLPIRSLDRISLKRHLDAIGTTIADPENKVA